MTTITQILYDLEIAEGFKMRIYNKILLKNAFLKYMPDNLLNVFKAIKSSQKIHRIHSKAKIRHLKKTGEIITRDKLIQDLKSLGLTPGCKVMVHSSLSGIGYIEGGAKDVIGALLDVIGPGGLLVMPCPPLTGSSLERVRAGVVYDNKNTPCTTGIICEEFRQMQGVFRSMHPVQSVAASGPEADWLTKSHHYDSTPFGPNSPYKKLFEIDAYVLCLGVDFKYITLYHLFEELCEQYPLRVYYEQTFIIPVVKNGKTTMVSTSYHDQAVSSVRENNDPETYDILARALFACGNVLSGVVGNREAYLIKAADIIKVLEKMLYEDGQTIYNCNILRRLKPEAIICDPKSLIKNNLSDG